MTSTRIDPFLKQKQDFLSKLDKSKKGSIDEKMAPIIALINCLEDYYTTSSCAGRIVLLHQLSPAKQDSEWIFSSHSPIKATQLKSALSLPKIPKKGIVWLLVEAPIIHVACRTMEDAWKLVEVIKRSGIKRVSVISSTSHKTTVEAFGTKRIEMPIALNGNLTISLSTLPQLIKQANTKLKHSHDLLAKLTHVIQETRGSIPLFDSP